jgi:ABC-type dipeptide/oligopeptide/nickel transport system permease component
MIDAFDIIAFAVFAVLLAVAVILVVTLGQLPGQVAQKRGHPQAAAINVTGWLGVVVPPLWLIALIWAFLRPIAIVSSGGEEKEARP